jgi:hypothetical protein
MINPSTVRFSSEICTHKMDDELVTRHNHNQTMSFTCTEEKVENQNHKVQTRCLRVHEAAINHTMDNYRLQLIVNNRPAECLLPARMGVPFKADIQTRCSSIRP